MIKEIIDKLVALLAVSALLASCSESELWQNPQTEARDGYIMLNFKTEIPAMQEVVTRAVDPDGGGVQDMTLFCFDSYGLFISTVKAGVTVQKPGPGEMEGTFKAEVPENTRTIHFLANQNMDEFKEDSFRNKSESEVMAVLEGSSGRMIYWGRFACDAGNDSNIAEQMATSGNSVKLIRNHARISVDNPDNNGHIVITGFAVCNTNAFGTVAPHHPKKGFDFTWPSSDDPFVTLPVNDAKMSDITDVTSSMNQYVFECENSADAIDWLDENGITLHSVSSFGGASVKRIHRPVDAEGKTLSVGSYMIPLLQENCDKAGVQTLLNTTATELLTDANGAVVGVKATGSTGETITVNAKAVVLTTGGFGANLDMVIKYKPELKGFMTTNAAGAQGQGIEMATAVGADTVDMDQIQIHPTVEANTAALITEGLRGDGAVLINAEGKRFIDEVGTRDVVSAAEIAQTGSYSWLVVDQAMVDASSVIQGYIKKGYTVTGQTYEELAKAMGVDEAAFAETMKTWNGYVAAKNDPDFGRTSFAKALDNAPYYAIKVTAGVHHTMGGLKINTNTEVLKADGSVIPGLFAAGEVTGGVHGANRLGGNAVADFTVFGRIAGAAASKYAA